MTKDEFFIYFSQTDHDQLLDLCRETLFQGIPYVFNEDKKKFYLFRKRIADYWKVHYHDIHITGSAVLGFSIFKQTDFSLDSDIDVAIISNELFEEIMKDIHKYQLNFRENRALLSKQDINKYHKFLEYIAMGWIRPDLLPTNLIEDISILKDNWIEFFQSISNNKSEVGNYEVSAGVFKSNSHLEEYTLLGMKLIHKKMLVKA